MKEELKQRLKHYLKQKDYWRLNITWMSIISLQFYWIKFMMNRELAFLNPSWNEDDRKFAVRMIRAHNIQAFQIALKTKGFLDKPRILNFYYSLASYWHGIPFNDSEHLFIKKKDFKQQHYRDMKSYDMLIDIDCHDFEECDTIGKESALAICIYLKEKNVPFEARFSGRGFHVIIPYNIMKVWIKNSFSFNPDDENCIYDAYKSFAKMLHDEFSEWIDLSIYDSRRVIKMPYSLVFYKLPDDNIKVMVAYPFSTMEELKYFHTSDYELENFLNSKPDFDSDAKNKKWCE